MRFVSTDIETLGLDENYCDIIEFGAVIGDLTDCDLFELPAFHCYLTKPNNHYQGDAFAMSMHPKILKRIADREAGYAYMPADCLDEAFGEWLAEQGYSEKEKVIFAGKNFAGFDLRFLKRIGFGQHFKIHHRSIDPGSMFITPEDKEPPGLETCLQRAGIEKKVNHSAIDDAIDVIRCIRYKLSPAD
jgi:oligoribonuclease (3'-5' exoribonuclease)